MTRQWVLIDADDTLWENNIYFEQAFDEFVQLLNHPRLSPAQVREVLDSIEIEKHSGQRIRRTEVWTQHAAVLPAAGGTTVHRRRTGVPSCKWLIALPTSR